MVAKIQLLSIMMFWFKASLLEKKPVMEDSSIVFTASLASIHLLIFFVSIITNFVASDLASSGSKVKADKKSKLFWRLTVLQCRLAQFDNLLRLPLIIRLYTWNNNDSTLIKVIGNCNEKIGFTMLKSFLILNSF